jgi:hypothetical protein
MRDNDQFIVKLDENAYQKIVDIANKANFNESELNKDDKVSLITSQIINEYYKNYLIDNLLF